MTSDSDTSRLEDIKHKDGVEMIDENRAVIRTDDTDNPEDSDTHILYFELISGNDKITEKITADSEDELFLKFTSWFNAKSSADVSEYLED